MDKQSNHRKSDSGNNLFHRLILHSQRQATGDDVASEATRVPSNSPRWFSEPSRDNDNAACGANSSISLSSGEYVRDDGSLLSLQPWIFRRDGVQMKGNDRFSEARGFDLDGVKISPTTSVSVGRRLERSQSLLRSRRTRKHTLKPLSSIESCLVPSLYSEHFEIVEYVYSSDNSPAAPTLRPFVVTDGCKVISKSSYDPETLENGFRNGVNGINAGATKSPLGVSSLPESRGSKRKHLQNRKSDSVDSQASRKVSHTKGSLDGMLLLCIGISIGAMATVLSNRKEVEKLNDLLKHTENLVQDLQEELEMKDSLTVSELTDEKFESQERTYIQANNEEASGMFHNQVRKSYICSREEGNSKKPHFLKAVHESESMSKIEAELEAELERLELNMNAISLDNRMSALGELDTDLVAEVVHGELREDMFDPGAQNDQADRVRDSDSTSSTQTNMNCAVSPRELSLRLHEVIQSRLEERIKELEQALYHSQKQIHVMEAERANSYDFSNSDVGSSSNQGSPIIVGQCNALAPPMCLNLGGDALNAYNEACEEFTRMSETEDNSSLHPANLSLAWGLEDQDGNLNKPLASTNSLERVPTWEQIWRSRDSDDTGQTDDNIDDEEGKMLIKQILERTRQGSPVLRHAQRMLFLMDG